MYHLRLSGDHYAMGKKRGELFAKNNITFPINLDEFQLKHGNASEKILVEFFPEICEEIKGVCDATTNDYGIFSSWLLCMGCCMYNLESCIPQIRGCTAFAFECGGRLIYGRNNDLPPFLEKLSASDVYRPNGGNSFNITTSSFINGEEGINELGLVVAMTFVPTKFSEIKPGFNSPFVVRFLLEKANNVKNAIDLLKILPVSSNCNILLADSSGDMVVVECTPNNKHIRQAEEYPEGKIICAVNNFTSVEMAKYDYSDGNVYNSRERYSVVMNSLAALSCGNPFENTLKLLRGEYGFMCQYTDPDFKTVWSSMFDIKTLKIMRAEGDPRRKKFKEDLRLCKK